MLPVSLKNGQSKASDTKEKSHEKLKVFIDLQKFLDHARVQKRLQCYNLDFLNKIEKRCNFEFS